MREPENRRENLHRGADHLLWTLQKKSWALRKWLGKFQARPGEDLSPKGRALFWGWNALLLLGAALALGLTSLALAPANYGWDIFFSYLGHPVLLWLNLLPPLILIFLLYGLTGRAWLSYVLTALPVLGLSIGNYYKLVFRDDPVMASDLFLLGEAGKMMERYHLYPAVKVVAALLLAVLTAVLLALFAKGRPRWPYREILAVAAVAVMVLSVPAYTSDRVYEANTNFGRLSELLATNQFITRGFLYPFLHSVKDASPDPPEGYSERDAATLLARYEDWEIPEDQKVNIVAIMLESFADFSGYEQIEFQQDVYAPYHALEAESYSGTLITDIFAGDTVQTERAFLTGIPGLNHEYHTDTSSYVWYLKGQGYQTSGDHPCFAWFYDREHVNTYLGFDSYRFVENYYTQFTGGNVALDNIFLPELTASVMDKLGEDAPLFSFSVSYQGHGPYDTGVCWWGQVDDYVANYDLDQDARDILANYFGSVLDTQKHLAEMVDTFRSSDEPIVLVLFGDHKPWLGNSNSVYQALGIDLSQRSDESFYNYWSTKYLIWANDAAKAALGTDLTGEGPTISPCFLMNVLFEQLGWEGDAYMQASRAVRTALPVLHNSSTRLTQEGELVRTLSDSQEALLQEFRLLFYYRGQHFSH